MVSRPVFFLFLTLSVLIILIGIMLVIFIQFDRGYSISSTGDDFKEEQNRLIQHLYKVSSGNSLEKASFNITPSSSDTHQAQTKVKPETQDSHVPLTTDQEIARINYLNQNQSTKTQVKPWQDDQLYFDNYENYQRYLLSSNPWSPDYTPRRY